MRKTRRRSKRQRKDFSFLSVLFALFCPWGNLFKSSPIVGIVVTISLLVDWEIGDRERRERERACGVSVDLKSIKKRRDRTEKSRAIFFVPSFFCFSLPSYPSLSL